MESFVASSAMQEEATPASETTDEMTPTATAEPTDEMTPTTTAEAPETIPETGATGGSNTRLLVGLVGLFVLLLGGALYWRRTANTNA